MNCSSQQYQRCAFTKSLRLTSKLGILLQSTLTNGKMHAHNLRCDDRLRQAVHHPSLEGVCPVGRDDGILLSNELHGKSDVLVRSGNHEALTHLGQFGGHVKGNLALDGNTLAGILGIERTGERNDVGFGRRILRQEGE